MSYVICFLAADGHLTCQLSAEFSDRDHARQYASEVIGAAPGREIFTSFEVHGGDAPVILDWARLSRAHARRDSSHA